MSMAKSNFDLLLGSRSSSKPSASATCSSPMSCLPSRSMIVLTRTSSQGVGCISPHLNADLTFAFASSITVGSFVVSAAFNPRLAVITELVIALRFRMSTQTCLPVAYCLPSILALALNCLVILSRTSGSDCWN